MKRYTVGIVGAGFGVQAHLPALRSHSRFEVAALASPSSATRVAREQGIAHAFPSCAQMVAGVELDAVVIASPPFAHLEDVLAALERRRHVLCEKPLGMRVSDVETMLEASLAAGTACGVVHEFRFAPQAQALKELIDNGHLDPLRNLEITMLRTSLRRHERRPRSWWFERGRGGGLTGAVLSHLVDHANWLAGRRVERAVGFHRRANARRSDDAGEFESEVDDAGFALVQYADELVARVTADATTAVESYVCAAHGERRTAVASGPSILELALFAVDGDRTDELECKPSPYARFESLGANVPPLMELYDEFVRAMEGATNALPTFDDALATQRVLAAIGYGS